MRLIETPLFEGVARRVRPSPQSGGDAWSRPVRSTPRKQVQSPPAG